MSERMDDVVRTRTKDGMTVGPRPPRWMWHRWTLLLLGLLVAAGTVTLLLGKDKSAGESTVFALLLIQEKPPQILKDARASAPESEREFDAYRRTQVAILKSRRVLNDALSKAPKVAALPLVQSQQDPIAWLEDNLVVDFPVSPTVMRVALKGTRSEELVAVLNRVVDAYRQHVADAEDYRRREHLARLERFHEESRHKVRKMREALHTSQEKAGVDQQAERQQEARQAMAESGRDHRRALLARVAAEARLQYRQDNSKGDKESLAAIAKLKEDLAVRVALEKYLQAEHERLVRDSHTIIVRKDVSEIARLMEELAQLQHAGQKIREAYDSAQIELDAGPRVTLLHEAAIRPVK